jgi:GT2 family glycosyltransferase
LAELAVVTVSYSARMDLLERQAGALAGEVAVREWIVVANGNAPLVRTARLREAAGVVEIARNGGSAVGFAAGISAALTDDANRLVLLLDEDNLPGPGVIDELVAALREESGASAVAAFRPRLYWAESRGIVGRRADSCLGFHLFDLPGKAWRRLFLSPPVRRRVDLVSAGYGGLMFRREVVERIGLPEAGFVLYADDTEWTLRLTQGGGRIVLATDLVVTEMDRREEAGPGVFSLRRWLDVGEEFRLFYGVRNEAFIDTHRLRRNRVMHAVNRAAVLVLLGWFSRGKERQFALLREAMAAGEAGRLGVEPRFPLPEAR